MGCSGVIFAVALVTLANTCRLIWPKLCQSDSSSLLKQKWERVSVNIGKPFLLLGP